MNARVCRSCGMEEDPGKRIIHADMCGGEFIDRPQGAPPRNIKTQNICPPIPVRNFDWQAYDADTYDGPGSPLGEGATEQAAIDDLLEQLGERGGR